jgi:hypothetical protein
LVTNLYKRLGICNYSVKDDLTDEAQAGSSMVALDRNAKSSIEIAPMHFATNLKDPRALVVNDERSGMLLPEEWGLRSPASSSTMRLSKLKSRSGPADSFRSITATPATNVNGATLA